ncbi:hypothetical protein BH09PSE3_BH09PSE3_20780 [soil metagenome]
MGEPDLDEIWSVSAEWCVENNVDLRSSVRASRIDLGTLAVTLEDGDVLPADAVLIATGVRPRHLSGVTSTRVQYLKTLEDAAEIRAALLPGARVAIVGGGFIGLEAAAAARTRGSAVTLFEAGATPLAHILGDRVGSIVADMHRQQGVDIRAGVRIDAIEDEANGVRLTASDGTVLTADIVVVGIGVVPNDEIARASEITVGNGIRVDQFCRTSGPGVFAAGDVANHYHPGIDSRVRVEHFDNATRQAMVAARNMLGERVEYSDVHWFWSDQYDHNLQFVGHSAGYDRIVFRGRPEEFDFAAFYMKKDHIVAAFGIDRGGDIMVAKTLIAEKRPMADAVLADDEIDLSEMAFAIEETVVDTPATALSIEDPNYKRVARSGQVPDGVVRRFVIEGVELAVARSEGKIYALHNLCTHLSCRLTAGKVESGGLTCLCHGSIFELATGIPINPPATKRVRTFPIIEQNGQIFVRVTDS